MPRGITLNTLNTLIDWDVIPSFSPCGPPILIVDYWFKCYAFPVTLIIRLLYFSSASLWCFIYLFSCRPLCLMMLLLVHRYRALLPRGGSNGESSGRSAWWLLRLQYGRHSIAVSTPYTSAIMLYLISSILLGFFCSLFWLGPVFVWPAFCN